MTNKNAKEITKVRTLGKQTTYTIKSRKFVVTPVFKESGGETCGDILIRLMQADAAARS